MKTTTRVKKVKYGNLVRVAGVCFSLVACETSQAQKTPVESPMKTVPKSVFIVPATPQEGRDPFYPNSTGHGSQAVAAANGKVEIPLLFLNGLNLKPGSRMAIINGKSIAEGETAEVPTANGIVLVRCVEIKKGNSVVIEVGTQTQELRMRNE